MRAAVVALLALGAVSAIGATPTKARDYPFCIKGQNYGQPLGECSFSTYEQCRAAASGRLAFCDANPYFQGYAEPEPQLRRGRRHYRD